MIFFAEVQEIFHRWPQGHTARAPEGSNSKGGCTEQNVLYCAGNSLYLFNNGDLRQAPSFHDGDDHMRGLIALLIKFIINCLVKIFSGSILLIQFRMLMTKLRRVGIYHKPPGFGKAM